MASRLYIVMYHYTRDIKNSRYPNIKGLDIALFKQQLNFFKQNFQIVTMESVIEAWNIKMRQNAVISCGTTPHPC